MPSPQPFSRSPRCLRQPHLRIGAGTHGTRCKTEVASCAAPSLPYLPFPHLFLETPPERSPHPPRHNGRCRRRRWLQRVTGARAGTRHRRLLPHPRRRTRQEEPSRRVQVLMAPLPSCAPAPLCTPSHVGSSCAKRATRARPHRAHRRCVAAAATAAAQAATLRVACCFRTNPKEGLAARFTETCEGGWHNPATLAPSPSAGTPRAAISSPPPAVAHTHTSR